MNEYKQNKINKVTMKFIIYFLKKLKIVNIAICKYDTKPIKRFK